MKFKWLGMDLVAEAAILSRSSAYVIGVIF